MGRNIDKGDFMTLRDMFNEGLAIRKTCSGG
ncbi:Uncharacterised protein [Klebsiella pneumoniae]|nr:Uncharacterised protein [Klebsiella pneumoniae]SYF35760.1 Uncharacterised protein [Klebsiella pneumoniae]